MNQYYMYEQPAYVPRERITWGVRTLILITAGVFVGQLGLDILLGAPAAVLGNGPPGGIVSFLLAFQPDHLVRGWVWQPFTYLFLHSGLLHLFLNMLWLFFFGPDVERVLSTRQFLRFYMLCGAVGVLATYVGVLFRGVPVTVVGASGAVMGVLAAFAVINPERRLFLFPFPIPINARALVIIVIVLQIMSAAGQGSNTSVATHLGGIAVGFAYMKLTPLVRRRLWTARRANAREGRMDEVGKAVDNLFRFDKRKR
jgi:membrane associated rhomboid family serine protease